MTERELQAMKSTIIELYGEDAWENGMTDYFFKEDFIAMFEKYDAIKAASDSQYIKGLVEALRDYRESDFYRLQKKYDEVTKETMLTYSTAARAIENLPEDLR